MVRLRSSQMPKSKVEKAAHLLDDEMRVHFTHLRVTLYVRTTDARALDAVASLAGEDAITCYPGTPAKWKCAKESAILQLLQQCHPHMRWKGELALAIIAFLEATTAEGMFNAMVEVLRLREPRRTGRGTARFW